MKKIFLFVFLFIFTIASFSASELDSLLKDDADLFNELSADENGLVSKDVFVEKLNGQAFLQHLDSDKWFQIVANTAIKEKDTIITMENSSMRVRMEDETFINIGGRTKIYFDTLRGKPQEELITETGLKLAFGKVFSKVRKKVETGGKYEIEAGSVVAGVRGTQYLTELSKQGEVSVKVYEGNVFVVPVEVYRTREAQKKKEQAEKTKEKGTVAKPDEDSEDDGEETEGDQANDGTAEEDTDEAGADLTGTEGEPATGEEIVLGANEVIVVEDATSDWVIEVHNEVAPIELEESSSVSEELEEIKEEAGVVEETVTEESADKASEAVSEEIGDEEPEIDILQELQEAISNVEEEAVSTIEEQEEEVVLPTADITVNVR